MTGIGASVVPATVMRCHGRKNITRPSLVDGSRSPVEDGLKPYYEIKINAHNTERDIYPHSDMPYNRVHI